MNFNYDLVIKGGLVVDPSQGIEDKKDIAVSEGKIWSIEDETNSRSTERLIDASNKLVTPGLVDLHTHVYWDVSPWAVDADLKCLAKGVTTVVDAGSSGPLNFAGFRRYIIDNSETRIYALVNISSIGLAQCPRVGELEDVRNINYDYLVKVGKTNGDVVKGVKIRVDEKNVRQNGPAALRLAKEAARAIGVPLMVHVSGVLPGNLPFPDILKVVERGDVITHCLPPPYPPSVERSILLNEENEVLPEVMEAQKKGVFFDVGHGSGSFSWETAEKALEHGFVPNTISSDLHVYSVNGPVYDLPTVLSKFLFLGLPLSKVIELSTFAPACVLGLEDKIGTLKVGSQADIAIFSMEKGRFTYYDNSENSLVGVGKDIKKEKTIDKRLKPFKVIKSGIEFSPRDRRPPWAVTQEIGTVPPRF